MMDLSIIVPIYNQEKYLEECIESLLNQNIDNYEIILIDDGSTDSTEMITIKYQRDRRIKYYKQNNLGLGATRNNGLNYSLGEYVLFVDSDDVIHKNALSGLLEFAHGKNYDIVYFDEYLCDAKLDVIRIDATFPHMCTTIPKGEALMNCFKPAHICSRLFKRSVLSGIRFRTMWYEDMEAFPRILNAASNIGYFKVPIYYYRQHGSTITHNESDNRNTDVICAWESFKMYILDGIKEHEIFEDTLFDSIVSFCFFRPQFSLDYIEWYNINFAISDKDTKCFNGLSADMISEYELQALVYDLKEYEKIKKIKHAYISGESNYIIDGELNPCKRNICFKIVENSGPCLSYISVPSNSSLMRIFFEELETVNLISSKGKIKQKIIDRMILKIAMHKRLYIGIT